MRGTVPLARMRTAVTESMCFLNLSRNTLLVELVLLNTASVGQPRCVEDANLGKRLRIFTTFKKCWHLLYAVVARKFVKAGLSWSDSGGQNHLARWCGRGC
jgi:hypothetical protein